MNQQVLDEVGKFSKILDDPALERYCSEVVLDAVRSFEQEKQRSFFNWECVQRNMIV